MSTSTEGYADLLRRHLTAENDHNLEGTLATLTRDCVFDDRALGRSYRGHEGATEYYRMWWRAFDVLVSREDLYFTTAGVAVAETRFRGPHIGEFLGVAATGRMIDLPVVIFVDLRDALMAGERMYWDRMTVLTQIGATEHP